MSGETLEFQQVQQILRQEKDILYGHPTVVLVVSYLTKNGKGPQISNSEICNLYQEISMYGEELLKELCLEMAMPT